MNQPINKADNKFNCRVYYKKYKNLHLGHFSLLFHANEIGCYLYMPLNLDASASNRSKLLFELNYLQLERIKPIWLIDILPKDRCWSIEQQVNEADKLLSVKHALIHRKTHEFHQVVFKKIKPIIHDGLTLTGYVFNNASSNAPFHPTVLGLYRRGITADHLREFISWDGQVKSVDKLFDIAYFMCKTLPTVVGIINPIKITITNWPANTTEFSDYYQPLSDYIYISSMDKNFKTKKIIYLRGIRTFYLVYDGDNLATMHYVSKSIACRDSVTWLSDNPFSARFVLLPTRFDGINHTIYDGLISNNSTLKFKIPDKGVFTKDFAQPKTYIQTTWRHKDYH